MDQGTTRSPAGLAAVSDALLAMSRRLEVGDVLKTIVSRARELLGARYAALGVPDDCGGFARFVVDGVDERTWKAIGPLPRQHGILAAMLHEGPQRLDDVRADPRFEGWPAAHPEMTDFLGMPIRDGDEILGALYLANKEGANKERADGEGTGPGGTDGEGKDREQTDGEGTHRADAGRRPPATADGCGFTEEDEELLSLFAQHAAIALTNARLYERSRELTIAEERSRLAHELHDAVSQKLFSLRLTAQAAATLVDRAPARAKEAMGEVAALAAEAADELRAAVIELRPAALDEDGLVATLRSQVQVLDRAHTARVSFTSHDVRALPAAQEAALLRVAQEALHNALRHGDPRNVEVVLERRGPKAVLRIRDDGRGFAPEAVLQAGRHLGLVSMRDRATGVGGTLTVSSAPGEGAVVEMEVPGG
ncbi:MULTISPECIES: GAF domain-containing sensor histidine kinase [Streptomyces]|uniref:GAF domain-containing sensor histidine kinase n=1 Tax=Streptomyces sp. MJP52 TaxID=2940555 RepID=UPI00140D8D4A|nr:MULTISPECIES: GAF domain-containing sensor histidine kinase [Streptomyces]MDH6227619.1 signal transduction histidine kinase [Streptomyces sp. MJP52]